MRCVELSDHDENKRFEGQAAVLVVVRPGASGHSVLLTERAFHLSAHPGEIALPGGKWEPGDDGLLATALRETQEEVAIPAANLRVLGRLPVSYTGSGVAVTPFVAEMEGEVALRHDPSELASIFWMPQLELLRDARVRTDVFKRRGIEYWAPAYQYRGHHIWGFTARVLVQFMNAYWQAGIIRRHASPVFHYEL